MQMPDGLPAEIDLDRPSVARVYDYFLGGSHNFAVDRAFGRADAAVDARTPREIMPGQPGVPAPRRAVPGRRRASTSSSTSAPASPPSATCTRSPSRPTPSARVVYVDIDPVAVAHSRAMLAGNDRTAVVRGRPARAGADPGRRPRSRGLIDFARPVGVLLVAVLHFIPDADDPGRIVATLRDAARRPAATWSSPTPPSRTSRRRCSTRSAVGAVPADRDQLRSRGRGDHRLLRRLRRWSSRAWCSCRCGGPTRPPTSTSTPNGSAPSPESGGSR